MEKEDVGIVGLPRLRCCGIKRSLMSKRLRVPVK